MVNNKQFSDNLKSFDQQRRSFRPYGLTCEIWRPGLMQKPDRHNEIEINYFTEGSLTYLFRGVKMTIPKNSMALFWGLIPHQIIDYKEKTPYYVCTIPLSNFLEWKLPPFFVDHVFKGKVFVEDTSKQTGYDEFLFKNWNKDLSFSGTNRLVLLEMQARITRMANTFEYPTSEEESQMHSNSIDYVERMAMFIAKNYHKPIKASDIGTEVGLHPDYANVIFKKAFGSTLIEYTVQERISQAQHRLIITDTSIGDVGFECGFNSLSRFNVAFKRISKCTPREFRKKFKN